MALNYEGHVLQLDKLPQELLMRIVARLDVNSLKSVRLCCKVF